MLNYLLEHPVECQESVWDMAWLMGKYERDIVGPEAKADWVREEIESGVSRDEILDSIWEGYEKWAEEFLDDKKDSHYEGYDERD